MLVNLDSLLCPNGTLLPCDHYDRGRLGISRAELLDAITEGVRQAFCATNAPDAWGGRLDWDVQAWITEGVRQAMAGGNQSA